MNNESRDKEITELQQANLNLAYIAELQQANLNLAYIADLYEADLDLQAADISALRHRIDALEQGRAADIHVTARVSAATE